MEWLTAINPQIDWQKMEMTIQDHNGRHRIRPIDLRRSVNHKAALNILSAEQMSRQARKGEAVYLALIREKEEEDKDKSPPHLNHPDPRIQSLLRQYSGTFRTELPPSIPPDRGVHHDIDTRDALPKKIASYPLSMAKLEDPKKQIEMLSNQDLV